MNRISRTGILRPFLLTPGFLIGVSLLTQGLYGLVFVARYLDILKPSSWAFGYGASLWNILFKLFYLSSSFYLVFIMMKVFPRTRETERAWKLGIYSVAGSLVLAPIAIAVLEGGFPPTWFLEVRQIRIFYFRCKMLIVKDSFAGHSLSFSNRSAYCHSCYSCAKPPFQP